MNIFAYLFHTMKFFTIAPMYDAAFFRINKTKHSIVSYNCGAAFYVISESIYISYIR